MTSARLKYKTILQTIARTKVRKLLRLSALKSLALVALSLKQSRDRYATVV